MLPDRCSIKEKGGDCPNTPSYAISIVQDSGEYMVCVICEEHRTLMESRVNVMQSNGELPKGSIRFVELKPVGTDCVSNYPDEWKI